VVVNASMSQQMTLLGLVATVFYGVMIGTGQASLDLMPQFIISAMIFLTSGRIMRKAARQLARPDREEATEERKPLNLSWLRYLNRVAAFFAFVLLAVLLVKPLGVPLDEFVIHVTGADHFFAASVP
jgi:membrane-associated protease RseP (regulator of RpoE activity)